MAVFPGGVKPFTQHREAEIVWSAHVNDLQEEVSAIETIIGTAPHVDNGLHNRNYSWLSIKNRMEDIQRGRQVPFCQVNVASQSIGTAIETFAVFTGAIYDPFGLWPGNGSPFINIPFDGIWAFTANSHFFHENLFGVVENMIKIGTTYLAGDGPKPVNDIHGPSTRCSSAWEGAAYTGQRPHVRNYHTNGQTIQVATQLTARFVRYL